MLRITCDKNMMDEDLLKFQNVGFLNLDHNALVIDKFSIADHWRK
jgi:hypothetical protein